MRNTLLISLFAVFFLGCSTSEKDTVTPAELLKVEGNWYIDFIFNYRTPAGKNPINASLNAFPNSNFLNLSSDGKVTMKNLGISAYGLDIFDSESYGGVYVVDKDVLTITLDISGKKLVSYYKIESAGTNKLSLFQDKALFVKALEENKGSLGDATYKEYLAIYSDNARFESQVDLVK